MLGSVEAKANGSKLQMKHAGGENMESKINVPLEKMKYHSQFGELDSNL